MPMTKNLVVKVEAKKLLIADIIRFSAWFCSPIILLYFVTQDAGYIDAFKSAFPTIFVGAIGIAVKQLKSGNDNLAIFDDHVFGPAPTTWNSFFRAKVKLPVSDVKHWHTKEKNDATNNGVWCIGEQLGSQIILKTRNYDKKQLAKFLSALEVR